MEMLGINGFCIFEIVSAMKAMKTYLKPNATAVFAHIFFFEIGLLSINVLCIFEKVLAMKAKKTYVKSNSIRILVILFLIEMMGINVQNLFDPTLFYLKRKPVIRYREGLR